MHSRTAVTERIGAVHSKSLPAGHVDFCHFARDTGFRWVELKYESRLEDREALTRDANVVADLAARNGIDLSVHAAYDDPVNIGAGDRETRDASMTLYRASLAYATRIGAKRMTLHGGHIERSEYSRARYRDVMARTIDAFRVLDEEARRGGVSLCIENRHRFDRRKLRYPTYPGELRACRASVGGGIRFTIDSGHANSLRGHSYGAFVCGVGPDNVGITHLHDNDGTADQHLVPGEGTVDFRGFLSSWLHEEWQFPLLLELNSYDDFVRGKERLETWLTDLRSGTRVSAEVHGGP